MFVSQENPKQKPGCDLAGSASASAIHISSLFVENIGGALRKKERLKNTREKNRTFSKF